MSDNAKNRDFQIVEKFDEIEIYQKGSFYQKLGNEALENVKLENKALNIPSAFSKNGEIYYELPDGSYE